MERPELSKSLVRDLLDYNPITGHLRWRTRDRKWFSSDRAWRTFNTRFANKPALTSTNTSGYFQGPFLGKHELAHRLIWVWMTGDIPDEIDHKDGVRTNNKWVNLRNVCRSTNAKNHARQRNSTTGFTGVGFSEEHQKYRARITFEGKRHHLGLFTTPKEAAKAYDLAKRSFGFHDNHGRSPSGKSAT